MDGNSLDRPVPSTKYHKLTLVLRTFQKLHKRCPNQQSVSSNSLPANCRSQSKHRIWRVSKKAPSLSRYHLEKHTESHSSLPDYLNRQKKSIPLRCKRKFAQGFGLWQRRSLQAPDKHALSGKSSAARPVYPAQCAAYPAKRQQVARATKGKSVFLVTFPHRDVRECIDTPRIRPRNRPEFRTKGAKSKVSSSAPK